MGRSEEHAKSISEYFDEQDKKGLLRFITCGSVDDGKSTLIGRLLYDSKLILDDQLKTLRSDSIKHGAVSDDIDFALLVDGLEAEREQGITIDVAYRFFSTNKRKFIVADTPGHQQYTRNMATGASTADLAVILIDARKGVLTQTLRHSFIVSMLGIRNVIVAINKMDLVAFDEKVFDAIKTEYLSKSGNFIFDSITFVPVSALTGDNVISPSESTSWYSGKSLLEYLDTIDVAPKSHALPFRMPIQFVNRPNLDFRGYCGTIAAGNIKTGDKISVAKSGQSNEIIQIIGAGREVQQAIENDSVTLVLKDEIDVSRGDVFCDPAARPQVADQFAAHVIWMLNQHLYPGRSYMLKTGNQTVSCTVTEIKYKIDINSFEKLAAKELQMNDVAFCNISTSSPIAFDPYDDCRNTGSFILIDRFSNLTVGAGVIRFALRRASNVHMQALDINREAREQLKGQKAAALWFTGLSGAGKSTIANFVERKLHSLGKYTYILDGDNVRHGLNRDLGFTETDRVENIRRIAEVTKLFVDSGQIALVSFISPFRAERQLARRLFESGDFIEIYVATPLAVAESRDPKGLYKKAREGTLSNFTGIDSPYEQPENPELVLDTVAYDAEALADRVVSYLSEKGFI